MRVAVQPCSDPAAHQHYIDTILHTVSAVRILPFLDEGQREEFHRFCGDQVAVWGVTGGQSGQNAKKWARLERSDVALLYAKRRFFSIGTITLRLHSARLARELWGDAEEGVTWEYLYFLDEIRAIDVPLSRYNQALGYEPTNIVQGFQVHDGEKADALLAELGVDEIDDALPSLSEGLSREQYEDRLRALIATDLPARAMVRQEASLFRAYLFGAKATAPCALCGRELPASLLVSAHIKPRASCTEAERRDLSVVMRACKLGCDELYERGYIVVDETGHVRGADALASAPEGVRDAAANIVGLACSAFSGSSSSFFLWHREHPRRYLG